MIEYWVRLGAMTMGYAWGMAYLLQKGMRK